MTNETEIFDNCGTPGPIVNLARTEWNTAKKRTVTPELKAWLSNVLVPAMVNQYLAEPVERDNSGMGSIGERVQ